MQTVKSKVDISIPLLETNVFFREEGIRECHFLSQFGEITVSEHQHISLDSIFLFCSAL